MKIKSITISNWKSFEDHEPIRFSEGLNIIIGPNSSGKTNLANAIRMVCGYGPDYGGGFALRGNNEIQERDFNNPKKAIYLQLETDIGKETPISKTINDTGPFKEFHTKLKPRFFPIGARRELNELISPKYYNITLQNTDWDDISKTLKCKFKYHAGLKWESLSKIPTKEEFSELLNDKDQRLTEAGSGYAEILYILIELKIHRKRGVKCFLIEEPEINMHPRLLRQLATYLSELCRKEEIQFFITTHEALLINEALKNDGKIHQVSKKGGISTVVSTPSDEQLRQLVYDQLGNSPGDILLANYVIWVEGPSDVIYIKYWLNQAGVKESTYTFMFYGGSCISRISFDHIDEEILIHLCGLCAHWTIVIDSDINGKKTQDKQLLDHDGPFHPSLKNHLKPNAKRFWKEYNEHCWITGGKEIENYVHHEVLKEVLPTEKQVNDSRYSSVVEWKEITKSKSKTVIAKDVVRYYEEQGEPGNTYLFNRWGLNVEIQKLKKRIEDAARN